MSNSGLPAIALAVPLALSAQDSAGTAALGGVVTAERSGNPVEGVTIRVVGTSGFGITDAEGRFVISGLPPGVAEFVVSYAGEANGPHRVELIESRRVDLEVVLDLATFPTPREEGPLPDRERVIPVEELDVDIPPRVGKLHGFYTRMNDGDGEYITREEILELDPTQPSELLRRVIGLRVDPNRVPRRLGRRQSVAANRGGLGQTVGCELRYFLDGLEVPGFDIDDIPTRDLAGVEVYRSVSETPVQFRRRNVCAVIVLWTRDPSIPDPADGP